MKASSPPATLAARSASSPRPAYQTPSALGAANSAAGIGGFGHPETGVVKRRALGGALLGNLEEGVPELACSCFHAQVEVGVEIDDADSPFPPR